MEDQELRQRLETMEKQVAEAYGMARKLYRLIFWTIIVSIILFVVPLIGLFFEIPNLISTYSTIGNIGNLP
ncbi:MAG TPA: hypothetical protein VG102_00310 [Candidatus Paceibacterota bacterium]|jgi:hypothetical protein|nr:hypothetical protein [Candidatus Paceibacterota bacterium]